MGKSARDWAPRVLEVMERYPRGMTADDLHRNIGMPKGSAAQNLSKLALDGIITKVRDCKQYQLPALYVLNPVEPVQIEEQPPRYQRKYEAREDDIETEAGREWQQSEDERREAEFVRLLRLEANACRASTGADPYAYTQEGGTPTYVPKRSPDASPGSSAGWAASGGDA